MKFTVWDEGHPGIKIVTGKDATPQGFFQDVNNALNKIRSQPIGKGLLKTIAAKCLMSNKSVFIDYHQASAAGPSGNPKETYGYEKVDAEGHVYFMPGEGESASIAWDPKDPGPPYSPRPAFVGLAHELIHALHMVHGLQIYSTNDADGLAINEATVVGLGVFKDEPFTENAIRHEHGIALRTQYLKDGGDFAKNDCVTGRKPLPKYKSAAARP
jgi:hypothetical protein